jgi:superfamily I DNA/RNA helicase
MDALGCLNDAQRRAVLASCPHLLIQAGPGTGKTRVLVSRIVHLLTARNLPHDAILAITFTRHAAQELVNRIKAACSVPVSCHTFHAWAYDFLRDWQSVFNSTSMPFRLLQEQEAAEICNRIAWELGLAKGRNWYGLLSEARQFWPVALNTCELKQLFFAYQEYLQREGLWDYDHLLLEALNVLQTSAGRDFFAGHTFHVLVDEFQDVNAVQYELLRQMALAGANITAIGDANQAIYGFRGASPAFMQLFLQDLEGAECVSLQEVYRCPQVFLNAAQAVVCPSQEATLISARGQGRPIELRVFDNAYQEADWVAQEIEALAGGFSMERTENAMSVGSLAEVAVLYRTHSVSDEIWRRLNENGIPCARVQPKAVSQDLQLLLKGLTRQEFEECANVQTYLGQVLKRLGLQAPSPGLSAFLQLAEGVSNWEELQELATDLSFLDTAMREPLAVGLEAVSMLSIHAAKGLEFSVVFLVGMEEGVLPLFSADEAEEARLCYVAMTRAKERLHVSWCRHRHSKQASSNPSRFLERILPYVVTKAEVGSRQRRRPKQKRLF